MRDLPFVDLVGMDVRKRRAEAKVTMLTKTDGSWTKQEINKIVDITNNTVSYHPQHPTVLLLPGTPSGKKISCGLSKTTRFELTVITGMDNPELPYSPQFI